MLKEVEKIDSAIPDPELIARLEEVLEEAKEGRIVNYAMCAISFDGTKVHTGYMADRFPFDLLGGLRWLERRIIDSEIES